MCSLFWEWSRKICPLLDLFGISVTEWTEKIRSPFTSHSLLNHRKRSGCTKEIFFILEKFSRLFKWFSIVDKNTVDISKLVLKFYPSQAMSTSIMSKYQIGKKKKSKEGKEILTAWLTYTAVCICNVNFISVYQKSNFIKSQSIFFLPPQ